MYHILLHQLTTHQVKSDQIEELDLKSDLNDDKALTADLKCSWADSFADESYDSFSF